MTIPTSVMEDIKKRAEEKYPINWGLESNGNQRLGACIQQNAYIDALSEAWELMKRVYDEGYDNGQVDKELDLKDMDNMGKHEFLNQIFKK